MSEKTITKRVTKAKPATHKGIMTVGNFKLPNNLVKGIAKAAKKQGFTNFGVYAVG